MSEGGDCGWIGSSEHETDILPLQHRWIENFLTELVRRPQQALVFSEESFEMRDVGCDGTIVLPNLISHSNHLLSHVGTLLL